MTKVLLTTGCDPAEREWAEVLALTHPRMRSYATRHGYDFVPAWYRHVIDRSDEFYHPEAFVDGAVNYEVRADFIRWRQDRSRLAPNWIRYAVAEQMLRQGVDLVVYVDGDVVIMDKLEDVADAIPADRWLASPVNGPAVDNAGPGGPLWAVRRCPDALAFLEANWRGQVWKSHPAWTDGVDMLALLGYSTWPTVRKIAPSQYDAGFCELRREWMGWYPESGRFVHIGGGGFAGKAEKIRRMVG